MPRNQDIERAHKEEDGDETEREALLSGESSRLQPAQPTSHTDLSCHLPTFGLLHLSLAFLGGVIACLAMQFVLRGWFCFSSYSVGQDSDRVHSIAPSHVGSTEIHHFPPVSPTNAFPTFFPTDVGHPGGTPTGAEPALVATAPSYPLHSGAAQLVTPLTLGNVYDGGNNSFDLLRKWGNLSPWYSVDRTAFGIDSSPEPPESCRITGLHLLHRHGARYPTAWGESWKL